MHGFGLENSTRGEWMTSCKSCESSTYSNWWLISHNQSAHGQKMSIMDDIVPSWMKTHGGLWYPFCSRICHWLWIVRNWGLKVTLLETFAIWSKNMVFVKTPHAMQKCHKLLFSWIQGRPAWIGLWRQLLPTTFDCVYKMLVACASDNEGRSLFYVMNVMFFIAILSTLDKNQNITYVIWKDSSLLYEL